MSSDHVMMLSGHLNLFNPAVDSKWHHLSSQAMDHHDFPKERDPISPDWQRRNSAALQTHHFVSLPFPPPPPRTLSADPPDAVKRTIIFAPPLLPDDMAHAESLQLASAGQSIADSKLSATEEDDVDEADQLAETKEEDDSSTPPVQAFATLSFDIDTSRKATSSPPEELTLNKPILEGQVDPFSLLGITVDKDIMDALNVYMDLSSIPQLSRKFMPIVGIVQSRRDHWVPQSLQHPASANSLLAYVLTSDYTPRELVCESRIRRVLNEALQSTNALLRSSADNTSWAAIMSVVLLLITAQQMGEEAAAEAHAAGLAAMLKARAGPSKFEEEAIRCRRKFVKSSQRGFKELFDRGLTANDRRVVFLHLFTNPDFMAACNTDTNSLNLMLQHLLVASNSPSPAIAPPNPLEAVISNTFLILGGYYRCRPPDYRMHAVAAAVADTAALYGFTKSSKKKKSSSPTEPTSADSAALNIPSPSPAINATTAIAAHPGFHVWVALTHGSFATRPHARAGFAGMLRRATAQARLASFDAATEYVDDAFCQSPVILFPHLIAFWIEVFGQLLPGDAEDVGQILARPRKAKVRVVEMGP